MSIARGENEHSGHWELDRPRRCGHTVSEGDNLQIGTEEIRGSGESADAGKTRWAASAISGLPVPAAGGPGGGCKAGSRLRPPPSTADGEAMSHFNRTLTWEQTNVTLDPKCRWQNEARDAALRVRLSPIRISKKRGSAASSRSWEHQGAEVAATLRTADFSGTYPRRRRGGECYVVSAKTQPPASVWDSPTQTASFEKAKDPCP